MLMSSKTSILLVDDDQRNLTALRELLRGLSQNLVLARSGEEALRCALKDDFAVILLDVQMPGLDGFATARLIRERPRSRHTPIIFLTGIQADSHSIFRGYEAGAVDYIVKPLVPEVLMSKVSVFVELHQKNTVLTKEIAERRLVEDQLQESKKNLRALAARLQSVVEEERTRIAREIHDELGQALTGLKMDLTWLASRLDDAQKPLAMKAESMFRLIDETVHSVRRIAAGLRPGVLDDVGLPAAIEWQARDFRMRTGIRCHVALPSSNVELDQDRSTAAFRIFQELLTNVARHASATRVDVQVWLEANSLMLEVRDNGKGIADTTLDSPKSLGLLGMHERAQMFGGKIEIMGHQGKGTRAKVSIPLHVH
jgi:signal transduction histidine kinase